MVSRTATPVEWAIEMLDEASSLHEIQIILRSSVRAAVQSQGATVIWLEGDQCYYADEDAMAPLWKGQHFPVSACISGWSMLRDETVVIPDTRLDERIPQAAYRPTFVRSVLMVPIHALPIGAIGAYWVDPHEPSAEEIATMERLAQAAGKALTRVAAATARAASAGG